MIGQLSYSDDWWLTCEISRETGRYYRRLFEMYRWGVEKALPPSNGYHITIISPHELGMFDTSLWGYKSGDTIQFDILLEPQTNSNALWFPVVSKDIDDLRLKFGMPIERAIPLHFCVGYLRQGKDYTLDNPVAMNYDEFIRNTRSDHIQ